MAIVTNRKEQTSESKYEANLLVLRVIYDRRIELCWKREHLLCPEHNAPNDKLMNEPIKNE